MIDRDITHSKALVIDGNPTSRSVLAAQLRDLGVGTVMQTGRLAEARRQLETTRFDVVLCEQRFDEGGASGQDLLDDLRAANLLPYSTVFVMVTGSATYTQVAEAAESSLDSYLIKPHTATALAERLKHARHRKKTLKAIFDAIENQDFGNAARLCMQRFSAKEEFGVYAGRIGAELLLQLGKPAAARMLFEAIQAQRPAPWARLGIARAELEEGNLPRALKSLQALVADEPGFADSLDVLGRIHADQGNLGDARAAWRQAATLTPFAIGRLQRAGSLAFYAGDAAEAGKLLERAALIGARSKAFDPQCLLMLAFTRFGQRDGKAVRRCVDDLAAAAQRSASPSRIARFEAIADTLGLVLAHDLAAAVERLKAMGATIAEPDFDLEAASNFLALLTRIRLSEVNLHDADQWLDVIAMRFCTSRGTSELLAGACEGHAPYAQRIRDGHARITEVAEAAMGHSLKGDPATAARMLLDNAASTGNAKLLDIARRVVERHRPTMSDAQALADEAEAMTARIGVPVVAVPIGGATDRCGSSATPRVRATSTAVPAAACNEPAAGLLAA